MSIVVYIIIIFYVLLMVSLSVGFDKIKTHKINYKKDSETIFSVIIPFRNEAIHLPELLASIAQLSYPTSKVSFWFVNDASQDHSKELINTFSKQHPELDIKILENMRVSNAPKKDAILTAVQQLKSSWIITADADCILPKQWLEAFHSNIITANPKMIVAPVTYCEESTFFSYFQFLDFLSLQGTTVGSFGLGIPFMCNGANLAYQKEAFLEVEAFSGNTHIASGDDVFLLEKFVQKWSSDVQYLKSEAAIVKTFPVQSISDLIQQRVRWASKSKNYQLPQGKGVGLIVLATNLLFCLLPLFYFLKLITWELFCVFLISKLLADSLLLWKILRFTGQKFRVFPFLASFLIYPYFTVYVVIKSFFSSYIWKHRNFNL